MNADDLLGQVKDRGRFQLEVALLLDADAFAEARRLNEKLELLRLDPDDGDVTDTSIFDVAERLVALHRETPEQRFVLEARTASEWEALAEEYGDDSARFTVALFAACCVDPGGWDVEKATALKDSLTAGQWSVLTVALRQLNEGLFDLRPTRAATVLTRGTRPKSTTALPED